MSQFPEIKKLLAHLTDNNEFLETWIINWLAVYKQTGRKSEVGLCLAGGQGTGKSVFTRYVVGSIFSTTDLCKSDVSNQFCPWLATETDFFVIRELEDIRYSRVKLRVLTIIKCLISGAKILWNRKHQEAVYVNHPANVIIETNEPFSDIIAKLGRRYTLIMPKERLDPHTIDWSALQNEAQAFEQYLMSCPIDLFKYDSVALG